MIKDRKELESVLGHNKEEEIKRWIAELKQLQSWDETIPRQIIHSNPERNGNRYKHTHYKVRRGWFAQIINIFDTLIVYEAVSDIEKLTAMQQFEEIFTADAFKDRRLTTKEDIDLANKLLAIVLKNL